MDEIASKYYVYLSSCKEGHDSCTEYSSMVHDMVHGHMLYDTEIGRASCRERV